MHSTKTIKLHPNDIETFLPDNNMFRRAYNYAVHGWKSNQVLRSWAVDFPRRIFMKVVLMTGLAEAYDPPYTVAILYKKGEEIARTKPSNQLLGTYTCKIDERLSYSIQLVDKMTGKTVDTYETTRYVPIEKFEVYEENFVKNINDIAAPDKKPAAIRSTWNVCFPHNYTMAIHVCQDKQGQLYTQAVLTKNKRKFKPVKSAPQNTLTKPFIIKYNNVTYIVNIEGHAIKKSEESE